jgi:cytosine deaminase
MRKTFLHSPTDPSRYLLANVAIPPALCALQPSTDGWCHADILVENGNIKNVFPHSGPPAVAAERIDAGGSILISAMVDCHTHLDKAHVAAFQDFPPGDLLSAIAATVDNKNTWTAESLRNRVEFSLKSAYAYGVRAMRSHVDFTVDSPDFVWKVMTDIRNEWRGLVELQLSPLSGINNFQDPEFCRSIYDLADRNGRLGAFLYDQQNLVTQLTPVFEKAGAEGWDLDFHVDEGLDPSLNGLAAVAQVAHDTKFPGTVLCGHCVALSAYSPDRRDRTIISALQAGLHFVALPTSNLYLQSRDPENSPTQRGMAPVARLASLNATVSLAADNVRDGFCAFGDFDPMAVLGLGAQVAHLHEPARDWCALITTNPAASLNLEWMGNIEAGAPADLVLFAARNGGEMNMSHGAERRVIRNGEWIKAQLPAFRDLDEGVKIDA